MKNAPLFLLGLFVALVISFGAIVLGSHAQLGRLTAYFDDGEGQAYPQRLSGVAARGQQVYAELGCAACHTQQVRRPDFGSDQARGWGDRQSVARDYVHEARPQLGAARIGPDLANLARRQPTADSLNRLLYFGSATHPSYKFLFDERKVIGEPAAGRLELSANAVPAGYEIVPTERAQTLVSYLLSLNQTYTYPESKHVAPAAKAAAAPAKQDEKASPAAASEQKKKEGTQSK